MKKQAKIFILSLIIITGTFFFTIHSIAYLIAENPVFEIPLHDAINKTSGIQTFHQESGGKLHGGFDFRLENETEIIAPIDGSVTDVVYHKMDNGLWILDIIVSINAKWGYFIAFEPDTYDKSIIIEQSKYIFVREGDWVEVGDPLGILKPQNISVFPHIHWNVIKKPLITIAGLGADVSPYDCCSVDAKLVLDDLILIYGVPVSWD